MLKQINLHYKVTQERNYESMRHESGLQKYKREGQMFFFYLCDICICGLPKDGTIGAFLG